MTDCSNCSNIVESIVIRNRQTGNTGSLNRNLYVMLKFTERPKRLGMTSKKNIAFPEGNKLFAGDFVPIWMRQTLIWFNLQRDGTRNELSNIKETFAESFQLQMSVLHHHMSVFQSSMLVSLVHIGWAKCKEKVPDVSDPNQNVETRSHSNFKFT